MATKKANDVALARADVDAAECAVTFAAAELSSVKKSGRRDEGALGEGG